MALDTARRARLRAPIEMLLEAQYLEKDVLRALVARWAVHPQQTHERVTAALQELAEYERQGSGAESAIQHEYVNWQRFLNGDLSAASQLGFQAKPRDEARSFDFLLTLMPWERRRSQRHLSNRTRYELSLMLVTETRAATGRGQWSPDCTPAEQERIAHWGATTLLWGHWAIGSYSHFPADCAGHRHAARIRMALVDWRREHGSLPESLDALVGSYFEKLPSDPWTERPFDYWPQGVPFDVTEPIANEQRRVVLAEGTPFLWSSGRERITVHRAPDGSREYSYARTPIDEAEALARGLLFPIPPPAE
jgi:hypothetical protein